MIHSRLMFRNVYSMQIHIYNKSSSVFPVLFEFEEADKSVVSMNAQMLIDFVENSKVSVIVANTGSRKSTHFPIKYMEAYDICAYISNPKQDACWKNAEYVSKLADLSVGSTFGVSIRLYKEFGPDTKMYFCTAGTLLNYLNDHERMSQATHIFLDEAHESNIPNMALLLVLLKKIYDYPNLRLVIMSATMNESSFTSYFKCNAIRINVERSYPIEEICMDTFIEEVESNDADMHTHFWT